MELINGKYKHVTNILRVGKRVSNTENSLYSDLIFLEVETQNTKKYVVEEEY